MQSSHSNSLILLRCLQNLMMSPVNISESIVRRTSQSQKLTAVDVAIATEAVVRLTEQAIVNPEVY